VTPASELPAVVAFGESLREADLRRVYETSPFTGVYKHAGLVEEDWAWVESELAALLGLLRAVADAGEAVVVIFD